MIQGHRDRQRHGDAKMYPQKPEAMMTTNDVNLKKTCFEFVTLAVQAARLNQARQSGREMGRVGKKEGVERSSVTETANSALT